MKKHYQSNAYEYDQQSEANSASFQSYLKCSLSYWFWLITAIVSLMLIIVLLLPENSYPTSYLRLGFGAILVCFLPGYTFIRLLYPEHTSTKRQIPHLETTERLTLSLGMSIVLVGFVGLALNYTPLGVRLIPMLSSISIIIIAFAIAVLFREFNLQKNEI